MSITRVKLNKGKQWHTYGFMRLHSSDSQKTRVELSAWECLGLNSKIIKNSRCSLRHFHNFRSKNSLTLRRRFWGLAPQCFLHESVCNGNYPAVEVLLEFDANCNTSYAKGFSPIHAMSFNGNNRPCSYTIPLLRRHCDEFRGVPNLSHPNGQISMLHNAVLQSKKCCLAVPLKEGQPVDPVNSDGMTTSFTSNFK